METTRSRRPSGNAGSRSSGRPRSTRNWSPSVTIPARLGNHILLALTSHGELGATGRPTGYMVAEAAEPWAVLTDAGFQVDLVSPQGGQPPQTGFDPSDETQQRFMETMGDLLANTPRSSDVEATPYRAIFFAGGHGTMWDFPSDSGLQKLARSIYEDGGVVAAVCHGPAALTALTLSDGSYLVDGKNVAAFSNAEEAAVKLSDVVPFLLADRLAEHGAHLTHAPKFQPHVVRDGRLVTGQNPASSTGVAEQMIEALAEQEEPPAATATAPERH